MNIFDLLALRKKDSVNDNLQSNYIDIATRRLQWGRYTASGTNPTVTFPAAFKNTAYVVIPVMEVAANNHMYCCNVHTRTTTSFKVYKMVDNGESVTNTSDVDDFVWIAIGEKP